MRPAPRNPALLALLLTGLLACRSPAPTVELSQSSTPPAPAQQDAIAPAPHAAVPLAPLPLPDQLPATVYTRTAPASLVDERGTPLQVLTGHHTRLELRHLLRERALVACLHCPTPTEGWIQASRLMPPDHQPSQAELDDERLALALFVAQLRRELERDGSFPELEPDKAQREILLRLMDQGFAREDREALAPASGGAYAREGASIRLRVGPSGWRVLELELPEP